MAKQYVGVAPLTTIRTETGFGQVFAGDPVPGDITEKDLKRLVDEGFLGEVDVAEDASDEPAPGTEAFILREVGDDKALAQVALDEENGKDKPRKGLVAKLEKIVAGS